MSPVFLHKLAILVCLGLLSLSRAGPVKAKNNECSSRSPPFDPKMPMGYAYYNTGKGKYVSHSEKYPIRIHSVPKPPHAGHLKCLVYDKKGYFSNPDLRLLYVPEGDLFTQNTAVNYVIKQGMKPKSTIMVSVSSTTNLLDTMVIPRHMEDVVEIDCPTEEEQESSIVAHMDSSWKCLTIVGLD
ncbi:hypothetical protein DFJ43DRAFT_1100627 [Lentinula guzmanii]|uniref:Uncharacterized protein n=2 Tax=Lentinula TaxID=5352 RepID=A0AA38J3H5_9AGAR|nr:hypothetical protein DFJ43DRAFT_1100627 [Lentinula guzmanii]KAJ3780356.1 hypothetical protein GGU10DRAFT_369533 [Lentinula aff. detonsa]